MDRIERSEKKLNEIFGDARASMAEDPDFLNIMNRYIFGDVYNQGDLGDKIRSLISLAVLTVNQTLPQLHDHVIAALNVGLTPVEIKEAVYHCAPYVGFPKAINAINVVNEVFKSRNIRLPLESQTQTGEQNRIAKGMEVRARMSGDGAYKSIENAPEGQKHVQEYLNAMCFGDFFTRSGIELKTRELLTFCILCAQGGCESQMKGHARNNVNVGNEKKTLIAAITHCQPYVGWPRMLNALSCINEVLPE